MTSATGQSALPPVGSFWSRILARASWLSTASLAIFGGAIALTARASYAAARARIDIGHSSLVFRTIERIVIVLPCLWIIGFALAGLIMATKQDRSSRRIALSASMIGLFGGAMYLLALRGTFIAPSGYTLELRNDWLVLGWRSLMFGPELAVAFGLLVLPPGDTRGSRRWVMGPMLLGALLVLWGVPVAHHVVRLGLSREPVLRLTHGAFKVGVCLLVLSGVCAAVFGLRRIRRGRMAGDRASISWSRYAYGIALVALAPFAYDWWKPGPVVSIDTVTIQILCAAAPAVLLFPVLAIERGWSWPVGKTGQIWKVAALVSLVTILHVLLDFAVRRRVMGLSRTPTADPLEGRELMVTTVAAFLVCLAGDTVLRESTGRVLSWAGSPERWWTRLLRRRERFESVVPKQ